MKDADWALVDRLYDDRMFQRESAFTGNLRRLADDVARRGVLGVDE